MLKLSETYKMIKAIIIKTTEVEYTPSVSTKVRVLELDLQIYFKKYLHELLLSGMMFLYYWVVKYSSIDVEELFPMELAKIILNLLLKPFPYIL